MISLKRERLQGKRTYDHKHSDKKGPNRLYKFKRRVDEDGRPVSSTPGDNPCIQWKVIKVGRRQKGEQGKEDDGKGDPAGDCAGSTRGEERGIGRKRERRRRREGKRGRRGGKEASARASPASP